MSEWKPAILGDVVEINPEKTPKWDAGRQIRYVDIASVDASSGIKLHKTQELRFGDAPGRARRIIRQGDVLVSTVRPNLRAFAPVPAVLDGEVASTGFAVLRARSELVTPQFLWSLVRTQQFVDDMVAKSTGSNYPAIRPQDIADHSVMLPSLDEQGRIADAIGAVDRAITFAESSNSSRSTFRDALADSAFAKARSGQATMLTLADVLGPGGFVQTGPFGSQLHSHDYVDDGTPVIMPANIRDGRVETAEIARISQADAYRLTKHTVRAGDIVWSRRGDVTRFARITEDDEPMICGTGCLLIRPQHPDTTLWLSAWLSSQSMQNLIVDRAVGATMLNLNTSILSNLPVAVPDDELASMGQILESLGISHLLGAQHLERLRALRSELLGALMSGAHRIPETYDELMGA